MSLTFQQLNQICDLCSISIDESEKNKFVWQIDEIIDFVSKLQEVDIDSVDPLFHPLEDTYMDTASEQVDSSLKDCFVENVEHSVRENAVVIKSAIK